MVRDTWSDVNVVCHRDQSSRLQQEAQHPPSSLLLQTPDYTVRRLVVSDPLLVPKAIIFFKLGADSCMLTP